MWIGAPFFLKYALFLAYLTLKVLHPVEKNFSQDEFVIGVRKYLKLDIGTHLAEHAFTSDFTVVGACITELDNIFCQEKKMKCSTSKVRDVVENQTYNSKFFHKLPHKQERIPAPNIERHRVVSVEIPKYQWSFHNRRKTSRALASAVCLHPYFE